VRPVRGRGVLNFFLVLFSIFGLDLLTKIAIRARLPLGAEIPLLPGFSIVHVTNTGIAFGMFQNNNLAFAVIGVVVSVALILYALKLRREDPRAGLLFAVVIGGAMGNLFDRVAHGRVTDFLDFFVGIHHWPAFNVADSAICVGAALLFLNGLKENSKHRVPNSK
jgi:signal peptidase II